MTEMTVESTHIHHQADHDGIDPCPQDVLDEIVSYLVPSREIDVLTLAAFGLVDRSCRYTSHKILFSKVALYPKIRADAETFSNRDATDAIHPEKDRPSRLLCSIFYSTFQGSPDSEIGGYVKHIVLRLTNITEALSQSSVLPHKTIIAFTLRLTERLAR